MVFDIFRREIKISQYIVVAGKTPRGSNNLRVGIVHNITKKGTVVYHVPGTNMTCNALDSSNVCIIERDVALESYPKLEKHELN